MQTFGGLTLWHQRQRFRACNKSAIRHPTEGFTSRFRNNLFKIQISEPGQNLLFCYLKYMHFSISRNIFETYWFPSQIRLRVSIVVDRKGNSVQCEHISPKIFSCHKKDRNSWIQHACLLEKYINHSMKLIIYNIYVFFKMTCLSNFSPFRLLISATMIRTTQ